MKPKWDNREEVDFNMLGIPAICYFISLSLSDGNFKTTQLT